MNEVQIMRASVAITDLMVFVTCLYCFMRLRVVVASRKKLIDCYLVLFLSVAVAALAGAVHHQFFEEATDFWGTLPKIITMISIGYAAMNIWLIGCELTLSGSRLIAAEKVFRLLMYIYIGTVIFLENKFLVAIGFYLPAILFFLFGAVYRLLHYRESIHAWAVAGLIISVLAALIQVLHIELIPVYVNHNSLYHLVQIPGVLLLYRHAKECANWLPNH